MSIFLNNDFSNLPDSDRMIDIPLENPSIALYYNYYSLITYPEYEACDIIAIPSKYELKQFSFAFQKNSPYLSLFNNYLREMDETGVSEKIQAKYEPHDQVCPDSSGLPLGFESCFTAFLALMGGLVAGLVLFLIEFLTREILELNFSILDKYDNTKYQTVDKNIIFCKNCNCTSCHEIKDSLYRQENKMLPLTQTLQKIFDSI